MSGFITSSIMAITSGTMIGSYGEYSKKHGWPIGRFYLVYKISITIIYWFCIVGGSIELFFQTKWYFSLIAIVVSFMLGISLILFFKKNAQWLAFLILIASVLIYGFNGLEIIEIP